MARLAAILLLALAAACNRASDPGAREAGHAGEKAPLTQDARLAAIRAKFARIEMKPDVSFLSDEEKRVVNLLIDAANDMSAIYLRQKDVANPEMRAEIAASGRADVPALLDLFDLHFGVYDETDHHLPFYGESAAPPGAGFYPADMSKEEFDAWIAAHPEDRDAFMSPYTVIRRRDDRLVAIPYSQEYREFLKPAAAKLREAAAITSEPSLKKFLELRAASFLSDDYFESELAWMDLDGPIEIAIGPYEVYTDNLFGMKTAFEAFVTVKDPAKSAALDKYKAYLRDMEANLPVAEKYKNFKRGFESPIAVVTQVHGGGDNVPGIQTIAFNLPNDERVREAKGAKKVLLENVMAAKFQRILSPMAEKALVPEQARLLKQDYMAAETLFHELSHSLGPGAIEKDGRQTTVNAELKELYSAIEEGKADVMGAYNVLYMMERGELPIAEKQNFLATYFVGVLRAMRFGIAEAHGKGAAFQYKYFRDKGAVAWDETAKRFRIDFAQLEASIRDLTADLVILQGNGDYAAAKEFLAAMAKLDPPASDVIATMKDLPTDIQPIYPDRI